MKSGFGVRVLSSGTKPELQEELVLKGCSCGPEFGLKARSCGPELGLKAQSLIGLLKDLVGAKGTKYGYRVGAKGTKYGYLVGDKGTKLRKLGC